MANETAADRIRKALQGKPRVIHDPKTRAWDGNVGCVAEVRALDVIEVAGPLAGSDPIARDLHFGATNALDGVRTPNALRVLQLADDLHYVLDLAGA